MKIALVCPYDWSRHGGVRGHVASLARQLVEDHDVRVFAPARNSWTPDPGDELARLVTVVGHALPMPFNGAVAPIALSPLAARNVVTALDEFDPHVVHVHEPFVPAVGGAASTFGRGPIVATFHAWSDTRRLYSLTSPVARRIAHRWSARVAVSPAAQQHAARALGLPLGAFRVIPNGVDVDAFAKAEPIPELRDLERPLLLFVGRLEPRKGLDVLIRAYLRLRAGRPGLRLCVVGEGPERDRCQQMVPPSIRPDVLFVGAVDEAEKPRYHASADLYVAPNLGGESFGIVLLEAMAAGLPVVASDIAGFRGVLKDGRQGRLVPAGDAFALADALGPLLSNEKLRWAMAEEGRRTADAYAWPVVRRRVEAVYHSVLQSQPLSAH